MRGAKLISMKFQKIFKSLFGIFFFSLVASKSIAYQGLNFASETTNKLQAPQVFALKDLIANEEQKYKGIDFYEAKARNDVIERAKNYLQFRQSKNPKLKLEFLAKCEEKPSAFCDYINDRMLKAENLEKSSSPQIIRQIRNWILSANLNQLQSLAQTDLTKALKDIANSDKLKPLLEIIKLTKTCVSSPLLNSLAAKLEEYFPDEVYINEAKELYSRSVECGEDAASLKAAYRLSILNIWQDQCELAQNLLPSVEAAFNDYQARAKYWRVYCSEKQSDKKDLLQLDLNLRSESPINFQNILVHGDQVHLKISNDQTYELKVMNRSLIDSGSNKSIEAIESLIALGENNRAAEMAENLILKMGLSEAEVKLYLAYLMHSTKNSIAKFHILSQLFAETPRMIHETTLKMYFPLDYYEDAKRSATDLDPFIVLSIVRQESAFNPKARSKAGARGLMQVMLPTARKIARQASRKLFDPATNIQVGVKLFLNQVQRFNGDFELALAAYNAGRLKVEDWQRRYPVSDKMLFLELIPYRETREYVTMILRNYYWYQRLYGAQMNKLASYKLPSLIEKINQKNLLNTGLRPSESSDPSPPESVKNFDAESY